MFWWLLACGGGGATDTGTGDRVDSGGTSGDTGSTEALAGADVEAISVTGEPETWDFAVTLLSDDVDCSHYADWWEVVGEDGVLLFRRILNHSHADEQPFTRDGGPVTILGDQTVWVRGHQNDRGYGGKAMTGSVDGGFAQAAWPDGLGDGLETQEPLPEDCWY